MASEIYMPGPVCLIENAKGKLRVNPEGLKTLSAITQPVVVVAIVGLYRTGKSYLLNKLAGKNKGFSVGPTVQFHTKGLWMRCVPHPKQPNHTLVLLNKEGLGYVEEVTEFCSYILCNSKTKFNFIKFNGPEQGELLKEELREDSKTLQEKI
ncbi:guanylate-binding protein 1-like [Lemur catta]|uniref:guanylate-binding protein 1-like n=1 Tax=Lemur catta TaxID=9447 RepID=UPI001E26A5F0|nr:guanylate-binding protein 1-like [Lemur catta]